MLAQPSLFTDIPCIHFYNDAEMTKYNDVKTESQWRALGFKVATEERPTPWGYHITGTPLFDFYQVDLISKVPTKLYNQRLWYLDSIA